MAGPFVCSSFCLGGDFTVNPRNRSIRTARKPKYLHNDYVQVELDSEKSGSFLFALTDVEICFSTFSSSNSLTTALTVSLLLYY